MDLEHSYVIPSSMDQAWDVLLDVERVAQSMPGLTLTSVEGGQAHATVRIKVGPIHLTYTGTARLVEKDRASGAVLLEASGKETRGSRRGIRHGPHRA